MSDMTLVHIAVSAFGLLLQSSECPVVDPAAEVVDLAGWGVSLRLIGKTMNVDVPGQWLESAGPWSMFFEARDTIAWAPEDYEVRIAYLEPGDDARPFEVQTNMALRVAR